VIATSTDSQAVVSWVAPRNTGRAPLSSYIVEVLPKAKESWSFSVQPARTRVTVNYLEDDVSYSFEVAAKNSSGRYGPFSSPSRPTTPSPMVEVLNTLTLDSAPSVSSPASMARCNLTLSSVDCFDVQQNFWVANEPVRGTLRSQSLSNYPLFWMQNIVVIEQTGSGQWIAKPEAYVFAFGSNSPPYNPQLIACSMIFDPIGCSYNPTRAYVNLARKGFPSTIVVKSVVVDDTVRFYNSLLGSSPFFTWTEPQNPSMTGAPYSFEPFNVIYNPTSTLNIFAPQVVLVGEGGTQTLGTQFLSGTVGTLGSELRLWNKHVVRAQAVCPISPTDSSTAETGQSLQWTVSPRGEAHFTYMADSIDEGVAFLPQTGPCQEVYPPEVVPDSGP
jgi:hypothetical protein